MMMLLMMGSREKEGKSIVDNHCKSISRVLFLKSPFTNLYDDNGYDEGIAHTIDQKKKTIV